MIDLSFLIRKKSFKGMVHPVKVADILRFKVLVTFSSFIDGHHNCINITFYCEGLIYCAVTLTKGELPFHTFTPGFSPVLKLSKAQLETTN